jgi:hypothetical protein
MRNANEASLWADYQIAAHGEQDAAQALCDQRDWSLVESQGQVVALSSRLTSHARPALTVVPQHFAIQWSASREVTALFIPGVRHSRWRQGYAR